MITRYCLVPKMATHLIFTCLFLLATSVERASCQSPLYPYVPTSGCILGCDGSDTSASVHFYPLFYGQHRRNLSGINFQNYVVTVYPDGVISMGPDSAQYSFDRANQGFPYVGPGAALVAPFMADVDLSLGGRVYASSVDVRDEIMNFIRGIFPDLAGIDRIGWAMITWENVSYYGSTDPAQTNTFQAVLVAARDAELGGDYYDDDWSEYFSFAIFNYERLTWTAGINETNINSNQNMPGIGGLHAQVGFNSGDGKKFELVGSRNATVLDLDTSSNVGIPGRWVYRTDTDTIQGFQCANSSGRVALAPSSGVMMGGTAVSIIGPCFTSSSVIECTFGNQTVGGRYVGVDESGTARCITPPCLQEGPTQTTITVDGVQFDATFTYLSPTSVSPGVTRVDPVGNWYNDNEKTITWRNTDFDVDLTTGLQIDLVGYCQGGGNFLSNIYNIANVTIMESSYEELDPLELFMGTFCENDDCNKIGAIRIKDLDSEQAIWSDFFLLQAFCPIDQSIEWCEDWITESESSNSSEMLIPCPCTLNQAMINIPAFTPITGCGCNEERDPINCANRDCNVKCFRSRQISPCLTNGQECCYDPADGMLLGTTDDRSGYSYLAHQGGCSKRNGTIPWLSHLEKDVFPWFHCCMPDSDHTCSEYKRLRPAASCAGYQPVTPAMCGGDPHILTLDGSMWTFNGWGEFRMVEVGDGVVMMHARNQPITNQLATVIKAVGACMQESDGLHVEVRVGGLNAYARVRTANGSYVWEFVDFGQSKKMPYNENMPQRVRRRHKCPRPECGSMVTQLPRHLREVHEMSPAEAARMAQDVMKQEKEGKKFFSQKSLLRCKFCEKWFGNLNVHLKREHGGDKKERAKVVKLAKKTEKTTDQESAFEITFERDPKPFRHVSREQFPRSQAGSSGSSTQPAETVMQWREERFFRPQVKYPDSSDSSDDGSDTPTQEEPQDGGFVHEEIESDRPEGDAGPTHKHEARGRKVARRKRVVIRDSSEEDEKMAEPEAGDESKEEQRKKTGGKSKRPKRRKEHSEAVLLTFPYLRTGNVSPKRTMQTPPAPTLTPQNPSSAEHSIPPDLTPHPLD